MLPDTVRKLRCVLQHWYELREPDTKLSEINHRRFIDIKSLAMVATRQGLDAVKATVLDAGRGHLIAQPAYLPIGAGIFSGDLRVETAVRKTLTTGPMDYRLAAYYAAVYYVKSSEEITSILAETTMVGKGREQQAASEALHLAQQLPCSTCLRTSGIADQESIGWVPFRRGRFG